MSLVFASHRHTFLLHGLSKFLPNLVDQFSECIGTGDHVASNWLTVDRPVRFPLIDHEVNPVVTAIECAVDGLPFATFDAFEQSQFNCFQRARTTHCASLSNLDLQLLSLRQYAATNRSAFPMRLDPTSNCEPHRQPGLDCIPHCLAEHQLSLPRSGDLRQGDSTERGPSHSKLRFVLRFASLVRLSTSLDSHEAGIVDAAQLTVRQPMPDNSAEKVFETASITHLAVVEPPRLFVCVSINVVWGDVRPRPLNRPFEQTPEVLQPVRVNRSTNVFADVIDTSVHVPARQRRVSRSGIGVNPRAFHLDVANDVSLKRFGFSVSDDEHADLRAFGITFQDALDSRFAVCSAPFDLLFPHNLVHVLGLAADEGFVALDFAIHLAERTRLHCFADAVQHEPRRLLRNVQSPSQFVTADAVLVVGNRPDSDEPLIQSERTILKNGSDLEAKLLLTRGSVALDRSWSRCDFLAGVVTALGADDLSARPFDLAHEVVAVSGDREISSGFQQGFWDVFEHDFSKEKEQASETNSASQLTSRRFRLFRSGDLSTAGVCKSHPVGLPALYVSRAALPQAAPLIRRGPLGTGKLLSVVFVVLSGPNCFVVEALNLVDRVRLPVREFPVVSARAICQVIGFQQSVFDSPLNFTEVERQFSSLKDRDRLATGATNTSEEHHWEFESIHKFLSVYSCRRHFRFPLRNHPRLSLSRCHVDCDGCIVAIGDSASTT